MPVQVYRDLNRRMPHLLFDVDRAFALLKQKTRKRMSQVMKPDTGKLGVCKQRPKRTAQDIPLLERAPPVVGEYQVLVIPRTPQAQPLDRLAPAMLAQGVDRGRRQSNAAARLRGLGLTQDEAFLPARHGVPYLKPAGIQGDIPPAKPKEFPQAHPGAERQNVQRFESLAVGRVEQPTRLLS